jgi:hypothetical protein
MRHSRQLTLSGVLGGAAAIAAAASCSWGGYTGTGTSDAGLGQACDGVLQNCAGDLTCVVNECRSACTSDEQCAAGARCLWVSSTSCIGSNGQMGCYDFQGGDSGSASVQGYCIDNTSLQCTPNSSGGGGNDNSLCPANTSCASDGRCRNACVVGSSPTPCVAPETCMPVPGCMEGPCNSFCMGGPGHESSTDGGVGASGDAKASDSNTSDVPTTTALTFVSGLKSPTVIRATSAEVVWTDSSRSQLQYCPATGSCSPQSVPGANSVSSFALSADDYVFWDSPPGDGGPQAIEYCSLTGTCGSTPTSVPPGEMAVYDSAGLVFAAGPNAIDLCPTQPPCSPQAVAQTSGNVTAIALWSNYSGVSLAPLYWTYGGSVFECSLDSTCASPSLLAGSGSAVELAATMGGVYVVTQSPGPLVLLCSTCIPTTLVGSGVTHVAADDNGVYWTTATGQVQTCEGSACTQLKTLDENNGELGGIAINSTEAYWTVTSGTRAGTIRYVRR